MLPKLPWWIVARRESLQGAGCIRGFVWINIVEMPGKACVGLQCLGLKRLLFSGSVVWLFTVPWTVACQASLSFTISQSLLIFMSIESEMLSKHLILCHPLLILPSVFPSAMAFSNQLALHIRRPNYWYSASASVLPVNIQGWFPFGGTPNCEGTWGSWQSLCRRAGKGPCSGCLLVSPACLQPALAVCQPKGMFSGTTRGGSQQLQN